MDVLPEDGRSIKLSSKTAEQLRARYRESPDREVLMVPGETYLIRIDLDAIGHTFFQGHRIRLAIMSTLFPRISANPNTGNPIATDIADPIVSIQTIHQPTSRIRILVVDPLVTSDSSKQLKSLAGIRTLLFLICFSYVCFVKLI